jgi:hypothetical protein
MNMSSNLKSLASLSTGTARAVFESANAAYRAIFEGEEDELTELADLGEELGDELGGESGDESETETGMDTGSDSDAGTEDSAGDTGVEEPTEPDEPTEPSEPNDFPEPEQKPEDINAQHQPASVSADALIKELIDLKYPEKIRVVAQQMKQTSRGKVPTADDMVRPVAQAISRYMAKKGYAAMAKDDAIRVVKTIVMAATDVGKPKQNQD